MLSGGLLVFTDHRNLSGWCAFCQYKEGVLVSRMQDALSVEGAEPDWEPISDAGPLALGLCKGMLAYGIDDRLTLTQVLDHEWLDTTAQNEMKPLSASVAQSL